MNYDSVFIELFKNEITFYEAITKRKVLEAYRSSEVEDGNWQCNKSWAGVSCSDEAHELLLHGEKGKALEQMMVNFKKHAPEQVPTVKLSISGSRVVPALKAKGVTHCMLRRTQTQAPSKILHVFINVDITCNISKEELTRRGVEAAKAIKSLEAKGYRVNLYSGVIAKNGWGREAHGFCVKLKDAGQYTSIDRFVYPLTNPSWLRVCYFEWSAKSDPIYYSGMGRPINDRDDMEDLLRNQTGKHFLVLPLSARLSTQECVTYIERNVNRPPKKDKAHD